MVIVSHSEVEAYNLCQRRHYYAFGHRIQKQNHSDSLRRGIDGHWMFEQFFKHYMENQHWEDAHNHLGEVVGSWIALTDDVDQKGELTKLLGLIAGFLKHNEKKIRDWEIAGVEKEFRVPIDDTLTYAFTVDLVVWAGSWFEPVDWKFTQDFYSKPAMGVLPQIPKYIGGMRALGFNVKKGHYGFVRYRDLKSNDPKDLYRLEPITPNKQRIDRTFKEFLRVARKIQAMKALDLASWEDRTVRVANNLVCKSCAYRELCGMELEGTDPSKMIREEFKKSDYGYIEVTDA